MKKLIIAIMLLIGGALIADVWVKGYTRKDGTRVEGHWRSDPDGKKDNNWSHKGNTNPYTGKKGTKK